jgi:hypothetical protein
MKSGDAVLVTDSHRGIYFGYFVRRLENGNAIKLKNARHCFSYQCIEGHEGVYGLASGGPGDGSKVGPRVTMIIRDISKLVELTPEAIDRWEKATW